MSALPIDITPTADCCPPDPGATLEHDVAHLEIHGQIRGMSATRRNIENFPGFDPIAADNLPALQAAIDDGPGQLHLPRVYNIDGVPNFNNKNAIEVVGHGNARATGFAASGLLYTSDPGERLFDMRDSQAITIRNLKIAATADAASFDGGIFDLSSGDLSEEPSGHLFEGCAIGGHSTTRTPTAFLLDGSHQITIRGCDFFYLTHMTEGANHGVGAGGLVTVEGQCLWANAKVGHTVFNNPTSSYAVRDITLEGDSTGKLSIIKSPAGIAPRGFLLEAPWIGDINTPAGEAMIEWIGHDLKIVTPGGQITVPGATLAADDMRLVRILANNLRGLCIEGYVSGAGCVIDYGTTSGHFGFRHDFTTDHNTSEFAGTLPNNVVGIVPEYGRRLGNMTEAVGLTDPNGVVFASPGDVWTNRAGAANHVKWIKQTGTNSSTGWLAAA